MALAIKRSLRRFREDLVRLFRLGAVPSEPEARLRAGVSLILKVLAPHGFRFVSHESGNSSGCPFATGEFVRGNRRLELHVRESLGLVRYHFGSHSAGHEYYMRELGVFPHCQYPGFPNDPLDPFVRLAHDVAFAGEFISGDGRLLLRASEHEKTAIRERDEQESRCFAGDMRTLQQMRQAFRSGAYEQVVEFATKLNYPGKMTVAQRRMLKIAIVRTMSKT